MIKKLLSIICVALSMLSCLVFAGCTDRQNGGALPESVVPDKILIAYFSATGTTKGVAQKIAAYTGGTLHEITPATPYTSADLNYSDKNSRATREQNDDSARPEISGDVKDVAYDVVFLGYPIWWGQAPRIIYTFLEGYELAGKVIIPFCTSGSSGVGSSATNLHSCAPDAVWKDGTRFASNIGDSDIGSWVEGLGINIKREVGMVKVHCGSKVLDIDLADNPSAKAFYEKLREGDVVVTMNDYNNFEKVGSLGFSLEQTNTQITTSPGDVILYQGTSITIYYDTNSWNFTLLGKIKGMTRESMLDFFGGEGEVTVTFSLK